MRPACHAGPRDATGGADLLGAVLRRGRRRLLRLAGGRALLLLRFLLLLLRELSLALRERVIGFRHSAFPFRGPERTGGPMMPEPVAVRPFSIKKPAGNFAGVPGRMANPQDSANAWFETCGHISGPANVRDSTDAMRQKFNNQLDQRHGKPNGQERAQSARAGSGVAHEADRE